MKLLKLEHRGSIQVFQPTLRLLYVKQLLGSRSIMPMVDIAIESLDALIFDLGGVIVDLDHAKTITAMSQLADSEIGQFYTRHQQSLLFNQFETGEIGPDEFRDGLRSLLNFTASDDDIDVAWNALILGFPHQRIELIQTLRQCCPVYLLSNNDPIHLARCYELFAGTLGTVPGTLDEQFDQAYYSHQMGDRKPNASMYWQVLNDQGLDPARTLFVEDTAQNVVGAKAVGLQTLHITDGLRIEDITWFA